MLAVFKREVRAFFLTPIGYIYMGIFLFLSGLFFTFTILPQNPNIPPIVNYADVLGTMAFTLLFATPILTMRLISEEMKTGTDQLLLTSPVSLTGIIVGKYLAALFVFTCTLIVTLIYPIILSKFTIIDAYVVASGYLGYFLLGAVFISIGIFISSITQNQTIAAVISFCFLLFLWLMESMKLILNLSEQGQKVLNSFLILGRYEEFASGIINIGSILFFLSMIFVFLFLTFRTIEKRRWSKG